MISGFEPNNSTLSKIRRHTPEAGGNGLGANMKRGQALNPSTMDHRERSLFMALPPECECCCALCVDMYWQRPCCKAEGWPEVGEVTCKLLKEAACPAQLQGHISKLATPIRGDVKADN